MNWLKQTRSAVMLSTLALLLFLERVFLDFRYVSLEMEGVNDIMPFTAPYMGVALIIFGTWIMGLLGAVQGKRGAFFTLLGYNVLTLVFGLSTILILCPTPCQTGAPLADILDWAMIAIGVAASVSAIMALPAKQSLQAVEQG